MLILVDPSATFVVIDCAFSGARFVLLNWSTWCSVLMMLVLDFADPGATFVLVNCVFSGARFVLLN